MNQLDIGTKIQFRSIRYMGLGIQKKIQWQPAAIRQIDTTYIWIVYKDWLNRKVYARIPQPDVNRVENDKIVFEYSIIPGIKPELELIKTDSIEFMDIWQDYVDHQAQKQVMENKRRLDATTNANS